jgi:hypothetical protein
MTRVVYRIQVVINRIGIRRRERKTKGTEVVMTVEKKVVRKKVMVVRRTKGNYQAGRHGERKEVGCE